MVCSLFGSVFIIRFYYRFHNNVKKYYCKKGHDLVEDFTKHGKNHKKQIFSLNSLMY